MKHIIRFVIIVILGAGMASAAAATVYFGKGVRIGGHDVSNQTFDLKHRGEFYLYKGKPPKSGCYIRKNRDGSHTKVCHWKQKK